MNNLPMNPLSDLDEPGTELALASDFEMAPAQEEFNLSPAQKAAIVIAALGPESAGPIVQGIPDNHLKSFVRAFSEIDTVPPAALSQVIDEFMERLSGDDDEIKGGFEQARNLLSEFKGADEAMRLMEDIGAPTGRDTWQRLEEANDEALTEYLSKQHPQTVAVVLSKLNFDKGSFILGLLEEEVARDVLVRLSKPLSVDVQTLDVLADTFEREFLGPSKTSKKERNPGQMLGSMMNNLSSERREALVAHLAEASPDIMPEIQKFMLTFQDFAARVPPNSVAVVVRSVEEELLLKALKFGRQNAPDVVDFVMQNISQRMAQQYEEQLEKIAKVSVNDAEAAQRDIMAVVRQLDQSGEIKLNEIAVEGEEDE